jgi:hypothetical protein
MMRRQHASGGIRLASQERYELLPERMKHAAKNKKAG